MHALYADDMQAVNALILQRLQSDVALINQLGLYIINGGGKRMLLADAAERQGPGLSGGCRYQAGHHIEFLHTAPSCMIMWSMSPSYVVVVKPQRLFAMQQVLVVIL
jgi:hypothetical protein